VSRGVDEEDTVLRVAGMIPGKTEPADAARSPRQVVGVSLPASRGTAAEQHDAAGHAQRVEHEPGSFTSRSGIRENSVAAAK